MGRILRGEVYWADLDPTRGREQAGHLEEAEVNHLVEGLYDLIG